MLTQLEQMKLNAKLARFHGITGADEALAMAMLNEQTCRDLGPFDPAFSHFKQQQLDLEFIALMLEKQGANAAEASLQACPA